MKINFKRLKYTYVKTSLLTLFVCLLFLRGYTPFEKTGQNYFHVFVNGERVGVLGNAEAADKLLLTARKNVASKSEELTFMDVQMNMVGEEILWGLVDDEETVLAAMEDVLEDSVMETMHRSYTMKVNEYMVNLASADEVKALLQAAVAKYDTEGKFEVQLVHDANREFNVLTANVVKKEQEEAEEDNAVVSFDAGVQTVLRNMGAESDIEQEKEFADFELGLQSVNFSEEVEIVETYLPENQLTSLETAINEVVMEQEMPSEYVVVPGDTLSEISIKVDIPMDEIIEMNSDLLQDERSMLHIGDRLLITVPEPELSVSRMEQNYYEEIYDADIIYVDNDSWYTTQTKVLQQPSAGFRKVVANVTYLNDKEISREIQKEEIIMEAVAKVVERGTKIPPTYIRPISGGRVSSPFGRRSAPTAGASTYHKGIDWAISTGTSVYASCGGTITKAGWGSGYGYVVYIDHGDGMQTRYAHLSKVLVKAGQTVKQGERIALSGNTGISTGPHLHFEILLNGTAVNPSKYLK